ncbi:NAD(P)H-binding protein [Streptomyces sp. NPDC092952]|uniref:NAD(P)H-binding protein n=1 Tax=Streptomyces sp. NPDC092952 TaxID=3366018 RepID=UPI003819595B
MHTLVTGCRGRVGSALVPLLLRDGHTVRAASRTPEGLTATAAALPEGVPVVTCDLSDPATFEAALDGVDSVFLYAEPAGIDAFLDAARAAGVDHIVLLSSGSVLAPDPERNLIAASHHAVEQALIASPITATLLRPDAFASNAFQWAESVRARGSVDLPYPGSHSSPIDSEDIAEAALAVLTDARLRGGAYHLTGPESLTAAEQVGLVAAAAGRPVAVNTVSPEDWKKALSAHLPAPIADALLAYTAASDGVPAAVTDGVERLTGHPARTFADWTAKHAAAFRP